MWLKWLPWKWAVRRLARRHGFLDPIMVLTYLRRFAQPSEVMEPIELLRSGAVFHARGLMNSRAIQHNLDWVWPYWVERQFDPTDPSFVPRAFSLTHINLTHRNWTAVGLPGCKCLPIVDPRGLVTPLFDRWSIDGWVLTEDGERLLPSRLESVDQRILYDGDVRVSTSAQSGQMQLESDVQVLWEDHRPVCRIRMTARSARKGWLAVALRPYNPEGVSFLHQIDLEADRQGWRIEGAPLVRFSEPAERHAASEYHTGDVAMHMLATPDRTRAICDVGMATAAALFSIGDEGERQIDVRIGLHEDNPARERPDADGADPWDRELATLCRLTVPDERYQMLYDIAVRTLVLHSPQDVYPGPYTYKRFWFRDAAFILHAMLCAGLTRRAERVLDRFPALQNAFGYYHSQAGEWDSNGEVLWIMRRFCELTGQPPKPAWLATVEKAARWIVRKRLTETGGAPHAGLLPPGFSAEHLGLNDYYYWDDFWGVAGLRSAAWLLGRGGKPEQTREWERAANEFMGAIDRSVAYASRRLGRIAIPASPYRRMDSGAVGSLAVDYPLRLWAAGDERTMGTAEFLLRECLVRGGFFQDMIHSGINPYLTLHLAQALMRAGDARWARLIRTVAELASPTGQWPEAIHPLTGGGCMGDGQHVWAAAEWVMMMRNMFLYEEPEKGQLVLGAGIAPQWLRPGARLSIGPAPTSWGPVELTIEARAEQIRLDWIPQWREREPNIQIRLPGHAPIDVEPGVRSATVARGAAQ